MPASAFQRPTNARRRINPPAISSVNQFENDIARGPRGYEPRVMGQRKTQRKHQ